MFSKKMRIFVYNKKTKNYEELYDLSRKERQT